MTFRRACAVTDLPGPGALRAEIDGVPVAVVRDTDGRLHAIGGLCSHADVWLAEGELDGNLLECPHHGSLFDLDTGVPRNPPAVAPVPVYPLTVEGQEILVDVAGSTGAPARTPGALGAPVKEG
jgi:3-phenylpropionate/trans-cinnamate dioxygenase ferredoxin component